MTPRTLHGGPDIITLLSSLASGAGLSWVQPTEPSSGSGSRGGKRGKGGKERGKEVQDQWLDEPGDDQVAASPLIWPLLLR